MKDNFNLFLNMYKCYDWLNGMYWSGSCGCVWFLEWWIFYYDILDMEDIFFDFCCIMFVFVRKVIEEEVESDIFFFCVIGVDEKIEYWMQMKDV